MSSRDCSIPSDNKDACGGSADRLAELRSSIALPPCRFSSLISLFALMLFALMLSDEELCAVNGV